MVDIETVSGTASERMRLCTHLPDAHVCGGRNEQNSQHFVVDDAFNEGDETFSVTLANPTGAVLGSPNTATVTIVDNETSSAVTLFGVTPAGNGLVRFNSATPGTIDALVAITGLQPGENVLGIDVRPATLQLYILGSTSRLYTLDPGTGAATQVGTGTFATALNGTSFGFDFNPTVDRIRVTSDADQNLRLHPDTGAVAAVTTPRWRMRPVMRTRAKIQMWLGSPTRTTWPAATTTTLYDIDSGRDVLVVPRIPPNNGTLNTVGALGVDTTDVVGFDITNPGGTAYAALSVGGNSQLYTINLTTGAATLVGAIGGTAISGLTAVNPAPNPIDETRFFVRQQYLDFLNREPDPGWSGILG